MSRESNILGEYFYLVYLLYKPYCKNFGKKNKNTFVHYNIGQTLKNQYYMSKIQTFIKWVQDKQITSFVGLKGLFVKKVKNHKYKKINLFSCIFVLEREREKV